MIKIVLLKYYNWPNFIIRLCLISKLFSNFLVSRRGIWWRHKIEILKFEYLKNEKSFLGITVLSNSKNISNIPFNIKYRLYSHEHKNSWFMKPYIRKSKKRKKNWNCLQLWKRKFLNWNNILPSEKTDKSDWFY